MRLNFWHVFSPCPLEAPPVLCSHLTRVFLAQVRPDSVSSRNWEGDAPGGLLVTLRSSAGEAVFVYPFQTSLSDGGLQRQRLTALRERLGWLLVGCELAECYER